MVLKVIFSIRHISIQKIGALTLLVYEMHTCMHACINTILFENSLKHTPTIANHNLKKSDHYFCVVLSGLDGQKKVYLLVVVVLKKTENRDFRPLIIRQPKMLST